MKNLILIVLLSLTSLVNGQTFATFTTSFNGVTKVGVSHIPKKVGVYCEFGGNWMGQMTGFNNVSNHISNGGVTSNVNWYGENGSSYPVLPANEIFTSPQYGNTLLASGMVTNTLRRVDEDYVQVKKIINVGVIVKLTNNSSVSVGVGRYINTKKGNETGEVWTNTFEVRKYRDDLGVVGNSENIFVVAMNGNATTQTYSKEINDFTRKLNINIQYNYTMMEKTQLTMGYDSNIGITFGVNFKL